MQLSKASHYQKDCWNLRVNAHLLQLQDYEAQMQDDTQSDIEWLGEEITAVQNRIEILLSNLLLTNRTAQ
jgi:hypothetical protein